MGDGESHGMAFREWWEQQSISIDERVEYFRKWPAPPRWWASMADAIWDLSPWESEYDYTGHFEDFKALGFQGTDNYEEDLSKEGYDQEWYSNGQCCTNLQAAEVRTFGSV